MIRPGWLAAFAGLFLVGILCLAQQPRADLLTTGTGDNGNPVNITALDGTTTVGNCSSSGTSCTSGGLTTTRRNDLVVAIASYNTSANTLNSVTDSASVLTFALRKNYNPTGSTHLAEYVAVASNTLSSDAISGNFSTSNCCQQVYAFAVSGIDTGIKFDTNGSLPAVNAGGTATYPSITTSNARDFIYGLIGNFTNNCVTGPGVGWTQIILQSGGFNLAEYKTVVATQSGLTATYTGGACTIQAAIGDALVSR